MLNKSSEFNSMSSEFWVSNSEFSVSTWEGLLLPCPSFRVPISTESLLLSSTFVNLLGHMSAFRVPSSKFNGTCEWVLSSEFNGAWSITVVFNNRVNRRSYLHNLETSGCQIAHF